jgi:hypothetical protein
MNRHDPAHEDLLRDLAVGDLRDDSPEAQRLLESCAECRERLAELRRIAARLDEAGDLERRIRAEAEKSAGPPGEADRVGEILRAAAAGARPATRDARAPSPTSRRAAIAAIFLIGAAGLIALALRTFSGNEGEPSDPTMGAGELEATAPKGLVGEFTTFEWQGDLPAQGWFEVRVYRAGAPPGERALAEPGPIEETSWTPGTGATQLWPREIEWEVRVFDAEGNPRDSTGRIAATRRAE